MQFTLAHGFNEQSECQPFQEQHLIGNVRGKFSAIQQIKFLRQSRKWLQENSHRFDVLHATDGYERCVSPATFAEHCGLPAVVTIATHRGDLAGVPGSWRSLLGIPKLRQQRLKRLSAIVATSEAITGELTDYGVPSSKIARIPYGVDTDLFRVSTAEERREARKKLGLPDRLTILFVGGIFRRKRPHLIIDALGKLKCRGVEPQALFVGPQNDDAYVTELKSSAHQQGVAEQVHWFGFTRDVAPFYSAANLFVLASQSEGLPNAMLEAMSSGVAPIGTAISGITDLITEGVNGHVIAPDSDELARRIDDYASSPDSCVKHGEASRQIIVDRYGHDTVLRAYENLFRKVIAARG